MHSFLSKIQKLNPSNRNSRHQAHGNQVHGPLVHGNQVHGPLVHGNQVHGPLAHGNQVHGLLAHGNQVHGLLAHGNQVHGLLVHGSQVHGLLAHGSQALGILHLGHLLHGNQVLGIHSIHLGLPLHGSQALILLGNQAHHHGSNHHHLGNHISLVNGLSNQASLIILVIIIGETKLGTKMDMIHGILLKKMTAEIHGDTMMLKSMKKMHGIEDPQEEMITHLETVLIILPHHQEVIMKEKIIIPQEEKMRNGQDHLDTVIETQEEVISKIILPEDITKVQEKVIMKKNMVTKIEINTDTLRRVVIIMIITETLKCRNMVCPQDTIMVENII
jgi:hypothetical protein